MYKEVFENRIKMARSLMNISQTEVARCTGISQSKIAKIEQGTQEPNLESLGTLAAFYNVSLDWLLGLNNDMTTPPSS